MTINIALATHEAIVFGCDSIASRTEYVLDPFAFIRRDTEGNDVRGPDGKVTAEFSYTDIKNVVTSAWSGVTKMFAIHNYPPVAAVTSGLAKLNNQNMAALAAEFSAENQKEAFATVEDVANAFLLFFRKRFEDHYRESSLPENFQDDVNFLLGGFGTGDPFPSLYRVYVKLNKIVAVARGGQPGIYWAGQSDAVERVLFGYDTTLRNFIEAEFQREIDAYHSQMKESLVKTLDHIAEKTGNPLPEGLNTELPAAPTIKIPWSSNNLSIDIANLPIQAAIDLVSFLVLLQSGRSRFSEGVATVGGRTHIGIVRKGFGFQMLEEPALEHRYRGFGDGPK